MTGIDPGPLLDAVGVRYSPDQVRRLVQLIEQEVDERIELCLSGLATDAELAAQLDPTASLRDRAGLLFEMAPRFDDLVPQVIHGVGIDLVYRLGGWISVRLADEHPTGEARTAAIWVAQMRQHADRPPRPVVQRLGIPNLPRPMDDVLTRCTSRPWPGRRYSDAGPVAEALAFRGFLAPVRGGRTGAILHGAPALQDQARTIRDDEELASLDADERAEFDAVVLLQSQGLLPAQRVTMWRDAHFRDRSRHLRRVLRNELDHLIARTTGVTAEAPESWLYALPEADPARFTGIVR